MKKILLIIIVFTILSTTLLKLDLLDRETAKSLDSACMLMDEQPDSSLNILLSINPSDIKSEYLQAQYALYLTQAKHYNHINENSDSLISFAVDFYDANKSSNPIQRMLGHYYSGIINATRANIPMQSPTSSKPDNWLNLRISIYGLDGPNQR